MVALPAFPAMRRRFGALALCAAPALFAAPSFAADLFAQEWRLEPAQTTFAVQSVKKGNVVEISKFSSYHGSISKSGEAEVDINLESIDTGVDLRNVRMRFLFFETYKFPVATIHAKLDPAKLAGLAENRRVKTDLDVTLSLHGVDQALKVPVTVTLIKDDLVSVASTVPVVVKVDTYGLQPGLEKLQEAVNVVIVPAGTVAFDLVFHALGGVGGAAPAAVAAAAAAAPAPASGALESKGELTADECNTRFDVLSKTRAIYFESMSATIEAQSNDLLDTVVDIANRCPTLKIEISGHTDSDGRRAFNRKLSERRASAVFDYLTAHAVPAARLTARGYGDTEPVAGNDSEANKAKNRRIEFRVSS